MRALLLDAGNTRAKWAVCEQGRFLQGGKFAYDWSGLADQFQAQWGASGILDTAEKLVLCNVAGDSLESSLRQWLRAVALQDSASPTIENVVALGQAYGVQNAYRHPAQLGADRWAALVAAREYIDGASCVIDCGTALTVDVLNTEGRHIGGLIAPGMATMHKSLFENTAQVDLDPSVSASLFSVQDTAGAVQAGILAACKGAVQQALHECQGEGLPTPVCVVTGGDAEVLLPALPKGSLHEPDWVLKGLAIIAGCNQQR